MVMEQKQLRLREAGVAILVFIIVFTVYFSQRDLVTSSDSRWTLHLAASILRERNSNLDEYGEIIGENDLRVVEYGEHTYSHYPLGTSILILPFMPVLDAYARLFFPQDLSTQLVEHGMNRTIDLMELFLASVVAAMTSVVIYCIGRQYLSVQRTLLLVAIFAFGTSTWSSASRALWQHGPSMLMLALTLYLLILAQEKEWMVQFSGILLAFAYVIRPTNSIPVLLISIYVLARHRRYFPPYLLWAAAVAVPFILYNLSIYGSILQPYYIPGQGNVTVHSFWGGMAGILVSPSRGLLLYSPILLFSIFGIFLKIRQSNFGWLDGVLVAIILLHWLMLGTWRMWWGGHSYGPRLFADMIPFLVYFLIPVLQLLTWPANVREVAFLTLFTLSIMASFFIHYRGATQPSAWQWNSAVDGLVAGVDSAPSTRLWDWSDPQFLRGLRPGKLIVKPASQHIIGTEGETGVLDLTFTVLNVGDREFRWQVKKSPGINLVTDGGASGLHSWQGTSTVPGLGRETLAVKIDTSKFDVGTHSIGGILISALSTDGTEVRNSPVVVPVSVQIDSKRTAQGSPPPAFPVDKQHRVFLPLIMHPSAFVSTREQFIAPADIISDAQGQEEAEANLKALFGFGWYAMEHTDTDHWRWASSPAEIYIYSPKPARITVEITPASLYSGDINNPLGTHGVMRIRTDSGFKNERMTQVSTPFEFDLNVRQGWNVLLLELDSGQFQPTDSDPASGDNRTLSFAIKEIRMSVDTGGQFPKVLYDLLDTE